MAADVSNRSPKACSFSLVSVQLPSWLLHAGTFCARILGMTTAATATIATIGSVMRRIVFVDMSRLFYAYVLWPPLHAQLNSTRRVVSGGSEQRSCLGGQNDAPSTIQTHGI